MRSVADDLKRLDREAAARLSAEQRVALALELGDADLEGEPDALLQRAADHHRRARLDAWRAGRWAFGVAVADALHDPDHLPLSRAPIGLAREEEVVFLAVMDWFENWNSSLMRR